MKKNKRNILAFLIFIGLLVLWIFMFKYINPQAIVAKLGATNGYNILFLLGMIGGASTFTTPSYFIALTTLSIGGLNPFLLGLAGGLGITIGDTIIFFIGLSAGKKAPDKFKERVQKLEKRLEKKPKWVVNLILYSYIGFTPLPNEIATISMGLIGHKKRIILFILLLGNITSGILGSILIRYGVNLFNI